MRSCNSSATRAASVICRGISPPRSKTWRQQMRARAQLESTRRKSCGCSSHVLRRNYCLFLRSVRSPVCGVRKSCGSIGVKFVSSNASSKLLRPRRRQPHAVLRRCCPRSQLGCCPYVRRPVTWSATRATTCFAKRGSGIARAVSKWQARFLNSGGSRMRCGTVTQATTGGYQGCRAGRAGDGQLAGNALPQLPRACDRETSDRMVRRTSRNPKISKTNPERNRATSRLTARFDQELLHKYDEFLKAVAH